MLNHLAGFWNHLPEQIKPHIIQFGEFQIRYYGLMYLVSFLTVYLLVVYRLKTESFTLDKDAIQSYIMWLIVGLMAGARFGYVLIYNFSYYAYHPLEIFLPFSFTDGFHFTGLAGMSYHGGLIGMVLATILFCSKYKVSFWYITDLIIPAIPAGYFFGRLGNFINGELYGRSTSVAWGMYFPLDSTRQLRHPSQLYEAFFEGIVLFSVFWGLRKKVRLQGLFFSLYLIGYGVVRFCIEFVREPDPQIGLFAGVLTMGQILCLMMILVGTAIIFLKNNRANR